MGWQRWNRGTSRFEYSDNNGASWLNLPDIAYQVQDNNFYGYQTIYTRPGAGDASLFLLNTANVVGQQVYRILNYTNALRIWNEANTELFTINNAGNTSIAGNLTVGSNIFTTAHIYPGRVDVVGSQTSWYLGSHSAYGLYTNTGLFVGSNIWSVGYLYPGNVVTGAVQSSWYLGGHSSYGLYINTGLYLESGVWCGGIESRAHIRAAAGLYDYARGNPIGAWIASSITSINGDGTVAIYGGSASVFSYCLIGNTMIMRFGLENWTIASPCTAFNFNMPPGFAVGTISFGNCHMFNGGAWHDGSVTISPGTPYFQCYKYGLSAWSAGLSHVYGTIIIQV